MKTTAVLVKPIHVLGKNRKRIWQDGGYRDRARPYLARPHLAPDGFGGLDGFDGFDGSYGGPDVTGLTVLSEQQFRLTRATVPSALGV